MIITSVKSAVNFNNLKNDPNQLVYNVDSSDELVTVDAKTWDLSKLNGEGMPAINGTIKIPSEWYQNSEGVFFYTRASSASQVGRFLGDTTDAEDFAKLKNMYEKTYNVYNLEMKYDNFYFKDGPWYAFFIYSNTNIVEIVLTTTIGKELAFSIVESITIN